MRNITVEKIREFISDYETQLNAFLDDEIGFDKLMIDVKADSKYNHVRNTDLLIAKAISKLKQNDDRCSDCGVLLKDDYFLYKRESTINIDNSYPCVGYRCSMCGHTHFYNKRD